MAEEIHLPETKKRSFRLTEQTWFRLSMAAIFVSFLGTALGASGYFYRAYQKALSEKDSLLSQMEKAPEIPEVESIVKSVSKLIELPEGETPTLATVSDKTKLESQAFFKRAENGDKVLIYTSAGKAILYRPSLGKVIDMTAVNTTKPEEAMPQSTDAGSVAGEQTEAGANSESEDAALQGEQEEEGKEGSSISEKPFSVAIANGTATAGLAKKIGETIRETFAFAHIAKTMDAKKKDISKTIIVDVSGNFSEESKRLVELLHGEVGSLPEGETAPPGADIFVIVGSDAEQE